jgi:phosphoribosyl 1,2-cyclic phosphate phosphodiesterase
MRSGAIIDNDLKIDFCPDTVVQMQRFGRCLDQIQTLVFTHQHCDHIAPHELRWSALPYSHISPDKRIAVYGNGEVIKIIRQGLGGDIDSCRLELHEMKPLEPITTPTGDTVLPLPASHVAGAFVLRITRADCKSIFYGHDSGFYPGATLDALEKAGAVDIALFDCTSGGKTTNNQSHMDIDGVLKMVENLRGRGVLTPATKLIATHFSHNGKVLHEELVQRFLPHGVQVAFDGMVVRA